MNAINFKHTLILTILMIGISLSAQEKYTVKNNLNLVLSGTSTLHDWHMDAQEGTCTATFITGANNDIKDVTAMSFSMAAKSLKSGKGAMDKNAYKALKIEQFPNITAKLVRADVVSGANGAYTIKSVVNLTMAGKTLETPLVVTAKVLANGAIQISGEKKLSMKEYDMVPPSFMMGTVKTGNDVVLKFNFNLVGPSTAAN